jgi:hypothetical protein
MNESAFDCRSDYHLARVLFFHEQSGCRSFCPEPAGQRIYFDRVAGGDCDHCDSCGDAAARIVEGQTESAGGFLPFQFEAMGNQLAFVRG